MKLPFQQQQEPKTLYYRLTKTPALYDEKKNPSGYLISGTDIKNAAACIEHLVQSHDPTYVRLEMSSGLMEANKQGQPYSSEFEKIVETNANQMTLGVFYGAYTADGRADGPFGSGELKYCRAEPGTLIVKVTTNWLSLASAKNVKANLDTGYKVERYDPKAGKRQKHPLVKKVQGAAYWTARYVRRNLLGKNFKGRSKSSPQ